MINKMERRRSMNATHTRPSNKNQLKPLVYEDWARRETPTLSAEQSLEDENITTLGDFLQPPHRTNNTVVSIKYDKQEQSVHEGKGIRATSVCIGLSGVQSSTLTCWNQ
jgi:hypothetical protein